MRFANPAGLALLSLAIPVVVLHILRPRRTPLTVSSILLWRKLERPVSAAQPWQRLRWSALLVAQLLAVILLALAVARPERVGATPLAAHTVFIVDASGSMAATDGDPDRLADARARAMALRDRLPEGGVASIVAAGTVPRVALTANGERGAFERALRTIDQSQGRPDFADAFSLAQSLQGADRAIGYVFLTDGGLDDEETSRLPAGTRVETIGGGDTNRAITRLTAEPRQGGLRVRVTVRNAGGAEATQDVRIDVDGRTEARETVRLPAGATATLELDTPSGDLIEAFLDGDDLLASDDHAVAVAARRAELTVALVGDPLFWQEALTSIPGVTVQLVDAADADAVAGRGVQLAVFNGVDVPATVTVPFVAVATPNGVPAVPGDVSGAATRVIVDGEVERPAVTLVRTDDPLLSGLDLADVSVATAQHVASEAELLVAGVDAPLLLRGSRGGQPFVYLTFDLRDSSLPVQLAFPLLVDRLLGTLTGTDVVAQPLTVGDRLPVPAVGAEVTGPDAEVRVVEPGDQAPRASRGGFWRIVTPDGTERVIAVNPPATESAIAPASLAAPPAGAGAAVQPGRQSTPWLAWVLWPLLAVLAGEAFLARRTVGVGRGQWHWALGLRALVAALIALALADPTWRRAADRVATIFVVDASASIGPAGAEATAAFLAEAIDRRPDDAVAGIVVFGADAHVDQIVGPIEEYTGLATVVDTSATDVAAGLRLGAAVAPGDARRRLVVVSDGRINQGDVTDEIEALRDERIPIDVVAVPSGGATDAAVASVEAPRATHPGELVTIVAEITSTVDGRAAVVLRRDGEPVASRPVELVAGANTVRFEDVAPETAGTVVRYQVGVELAGDAVADNDIGFTAVPVEGPLRVLVIESSSGEAASLVAALQAGGVGVDVVGVADIPPVSDMITYAGVVLADVDARMLTGEQIEVLTTAVRDLGRGLVTIGGTQSYGVGGYRQSPLSDLLPVDSEILDPQRRRSVAEVLSIDTSESMGACHCDSPDMSGQINEGGVNKTDISRAAAERTISALAATDEVGVLAWNSSAQWVIPLQQLPAADVVDEGLRSLRPAGNTNIRDSLGDAAVALLESDAELKHIILFSDGFTDVRLIQDTAEEAGRLYDEYGITTSVLATGEGAAPSLEDIATQGHGRFHAGTDLEAVPQIMAEEAVIASRNFITEGAFLPEVTSDDEVVADLAASPSLAGYVATTAKSQASTLLRIGPDRDPLLATWQAGLGRVTSWTSDVNDWAVAWTAWDGFVPFWSDVVKDTLPAGDDAGALQARVRDGRVELSVETADTFPDGATATARVAGPDGQIITVELERTASGRFEGAADASRSGTYAVGATVVDADGGAVLSSSALSTSSYPVEFVPGLADDRALARLAEQTGGTRRRSAAEVWDPTGLPVGERAMRLLPWLLLAAALLWPLAVAISRVRLNRAVLATAGQSVGATARGLGGRLRDAVPSFGGDPDNRAAPAAPRRERRPTARSSAADPATTPPLAPPTEPALRIPVPPPPTTPPTPTDDPSSPPATLEDLLARRRARRGDD